MVIYIYMVIYGYIMVIWREGFEMRYLSFLCHILHHKVSGGSSSCGINSR